MITLLANSIEHELILEEDSQDIQVLQYQIFSLTSIPPTDQVIYNDNGSQISLNDIIKVDPKHFVRLFVVNQKSNPEFAFVAPNFTTQCTKTVAGEHPFLQIAFVDENKRLLCGFCASRKRWDQVKRLSHVKDYPYRPATSPITKLEIYAGSIDLDVPSAFTKVHHELNYTCNGAYQYLCYKRSGKELPIKAIFIQESNTPADAASHVIPMPIHTAGSDAPPLYIAYQQLTRKELREFCGMVVAQIRLSASSDIENGDEEWIRNPLNLNTGIKGASPLYLEYQLVQIGSFCCESETTLLSPQYQGLHRLGLNGKWAFDRYCCSTFKQLLLEDRRQREASGAEEMMLMLQRNAQHVFKYEQSPLQEKARRVIPIENLHNRARMNLEKPYDEADGYIRLPYREELLKQLISWFKTEFFTWMDSPECKACKRSTSRIGNGQPTQEDLAYGGHRVELYKCPSCSTTIRFPRYNEPGKLLETRTGRCGEWANCFTLVCRAMGFEARYIYDMTDHVWTEVYSEEYQRWIHCDPCENQMDLPLTYEVGWGKQLTYVFAFSKDEVVDVIHRYTNDFEERVDYRLKVSETWLENIIATLNLQQRMQSNLSQERINELEARALAEQREFTNGVPQRLSKKTSLGGRISGSAEWRASRAETGSKSNEPSKAIQSADCEDMQVGDSKILLTKLVQQMTIGCDKKEQGVSCFNPYCHDFQFGEKPSRDMSEAAAGALQTVSRLLNHGYGDYASALGTLLCSDLNHEGFASKILSCKPILYWQMQEPENTLRLHDSSGHEQNSITYGGSGDLGILGLHRPMDLKQQNGKHAHGIEFLPGRCIESSNLELGSRCSSEEKAYTFIVLFRLDEVSQNGSIHIPIVRLRLGTFDLQVGLIEDGKAFLRFTDEEKDETFTTHEALMEVGSGRPIVLGCTIVCSSLNLQLKLYRNGVELAIVNSSLNFDSPAYDGLNASAVLGDYQHREQKRLMYHFVLSHFALFDSIISMDTLSDLSKSCIIPAKLVQSRFYGGGNATELDGRGSSDDMYFLNEASQAAKLTSEYRVVRINAWSTSFVHGVQFIYAKYGAEGQAQQELPGHAFIGNHVKKPNGAALPAPDKTFELEHNEYIVGVSGRKGAWMDQISFSLNTGRKFVFGGNGGGAYEIEVPVGHEVRAIAANVGNHVTNICIFSGESRQLAEDPLYQACKSFGTRHSPSTTKESYKALMRYISNLVANPTEPKYRSIRIGNGFFQKTLGQFPGHEALLNACGFHSSDREFYILSPTVSAPHLMQCQHVLQTFLH